MPLVRRSVLLAVSATMLAGSGVAVAAVSAPNRQHASSTIGARTAGDPYFPRQGNGGYRVRHYGLDIGYRPTTRRLAGTAHLHAVAKQTLTRFDLDLRRFMHVSSVRVDGRAAAFRQPKSAKQELVITPARRLRKGHDFTVRVRYAGKAQSINDSDGALDGWIPTNDGAFVANEPQGAPTWFPVNDTPRDKATYRVSMRVPKRLAAIGNGDLRSRVRDGSKTTWTWRIGIPISSYLVTATIGKFDITRGRTPAGVPYLNAVDPSQQKAAAVLAKLPAIVDYFSTKYGAYPFKQTGAIVDYAPNVGYALETATRPLFDSAPDELTVAHELAHQWFGDTVTLRRWRDIWLNEGFAEFSSWLWDGHRGGMTPAEHFRLLKQNSTTWDPPPGNPGGSENVFAGSVYDRGAMALQALRTKIGSHTFFRIMRGWVALHRYGNATVPEFTAYAAQVSGRDLDHFFYRWLYRSGKP